MQRIGAVDSGESSVGWSLISPQETLYQFPRVQGSRTLYGTTDLFKTEKEVRQGCLLSACLFSLYAELITRNARLDELQAGIKIGRRNIHNLRHVGDTTLMSDSEEQLKSLLMGVKKESESC